MAQTSAQKQAAYRARKKRREIEVLEMLKQYRDICLKEPHASMNPFHLARCIELLERK